MKIIVDAMGGDHAPLQIVLGAVDAIKQDKSLQVVLVGDESAINQCLCDCKDYDKNRLSIIDAKDVITNDDTPTTAIRTKKREFACQSVRRTQSRRRCGRICFCRFDGRGFGGRIPQSRTH